MLHKDP